MAKVAKAPKQVKPRKVRMPKVKQPKIESVHVNDTSPMAYKKSC